MLILKEILMMISHKELSFFVEVNGRTRAKSK